MNNYTHNYITVQAAADDDEDDDDDEEEEEKEEEKEEEEGQQREEQDIEDQKTENKKRHQNSDLTIGNQRQNQQGKSASRNWVEPHNISVWSSPCIIQQRSAERRLNSEVYSPS